MGEVCPNFDVIILAQGCGYGLVAGQAYFFLSLFKYIPELTY